MHRRNRKLRPSDVDLSEVRWRSSERKRSRQSRALDRSGIALTLTYRSTGVVVQGKVPDGRYTRAKLRELRAALVARLFALMERKVARELRVPRF